MENLIKAAMLDGVLRSLRHMNLSVEELTAYADLKRAQEFQADGERLDVTIQRLWDNDGEFFSQLDTVLLAMEEYGLE